MIALLQDPDPFPALNSQQGTVVICIATVLLVVVLELVRRRKLREEYSLLWIGTSTFLMAMAVQPSFLGVFAQLVGAKEPASALFFGALIFVAAVLLLASVRLSRLTLRTKALARQTTLAQEELKELRRHIEDLQRHQPEPLEVVNSDVAQGF